MVVVDDADATSDKCAIDSSKIDEAVRMDEEEESVSFASCEEAIKVVKSGGMVIVMDDESRENEGDLIMAADAVTKEQCAFIIRYTTGILCAPMTAERAAELELPRMVKKNQDPNGTAFTITCDSIRTTTGVSAQDRATTFRELADMTHKAESFSRPGHVFPLIAKPGGVLQRRGHTEAAVDLCKMAGRSPVGVIGEITNDDGTMKRLHECARFAKKHGILLITVDEMVRYRRKLLEAKKREEESAKTRRARASPTTVSARLRKVDHVVKRKIDLENAIESVRGRVGCLPVPMLCVVTDRKGRIVMTNDEFQKFTGYSRREVFGYNCNFLQGKDTDPADIADIRSALDVEQGCSVVLLNYTKTGQRFWNVLSIRPLVDATTRQVTHYLGNIITIPIPSFAPMFVSRTQSARVGDMDVVPPLHVDDVLSLLTNISSIPMRIADTTAASGSRPRSDSDDDDDDSSRRHPRLFAGGRHVDIGGGLDFVASTILPTEHGRFRVCAYRNRKSGAEPLALVYGDISTAGGVVPVRVHDQCVTSEVFGSLRCDCRGQLLVSMKYVRDRGCGAILYLPQEGRGIGIANKIAAYNLQEKGLDTVDANRKLGLPDDAREYSCVRHILRHLEIHHIALMTNNPRKFHCLRCVGVSVADRIPCVAVKPPKRAIDYVRAKIERMGHMEDALGS